MKVTAERQVMNKVRRWALVEMRQTTDARTRFVLHDIAQALHRDNPFLKARRKKRR